MGNYQDREKCVLMFFYFVNYITDVELGEIFYFFVLIYFILFLIYVFLYYSIRVMVFNATFNTISDLL